MSKEHSAPRLRFWLETSLAFFTSILVIITLVWKDWIELIFGLDLDSWNGSLERLIVVGLLVGSLLLFFLAGYEWRKSRNLAS